MTPVVRGSALHGFAQFAQLQGLDSRQLLAHVNLPMDAQSQPDLQFPYAQFIALLEEGARRSANPLFGLGLGLHQGLNILGNLLYVAQNSKNVGDALKVLKHYFHLHNNGSEINIEKFGSSARLTYEVTIGDAASVSQDVELALGVGLHLMRSLLGRRWQPIALQLRHSPNTQASDYRRLLGITPRFDSPHNGWIFDAALLDVPLASADENLQQLIQQHIDELPQLSLHELPGFVQKLLRDMLPHGKVKIEQVAEYMMLSPRTLQRYLMEAGTGFQELLDETRQSLSTRYICDSSISMTQMAGMLGYADLSAFSRAFARWNGISPRKWKQQYRQEHGSHKNRKGWLAESHVTSCAG